MCVRGDDLAGIKAKDLATTESREAERPERSLSQLRGWLELFWFCVFKECYVQRSSWLVVDSMVAGAGGRVWRP